MTLGSKSSAFFLTRFAYVHVHTPNFKNLIFSIRRFDILFVSYGYVREFVNCVRCIKILSPQEVQQMSLDGDFGNGGLPRQASSSSDGGIA